MMSNYLLIGDLHAPFHHKKVLEFLKDVTKHFDGEDFEVICLGDLLDMYAFTRFIKNGDAMGAKEEFEKARTFTDELFTLFPKGRLCIGNHDLRLAKRASEIGIPGWALRGYRDLAGIPEGWTLASEFEVNGVKYFHGERLTSNSQLAIRKIGQSVVYGHCLKLTSKVLVKDKGYISIGDVQIGDKVYGYREGKVVETVVKDTTRFNYSGEMLKFNHKYLSQDVTINHHLYTKDDRYLPCTQEGLLLSDMPFSATSLELPEYPIEDDLLRLQIAISADSSLENKSLIRFHLKKLRKVVRLEELLVKLNIEYTLNYQESTDTYKINFNSNLTKALPDYMKKLSSRQRSLLLEELVLWDGSILREDAFQFSSHIPSSIELVSEILTQQGLKHSICKQGTVICWRYDKELLGGNGRPSDKLLSEISQKYQVENEIVACITTELNNFYVLTEEGKVELTGNTHQGSITYKATSRELTFAFNVGCLIDQHTYAFEYASSTIEKCFIGCGIIKNGIPMLIPMPLGSRIITAEKRGRGRPRKDRV